MADVRKRVAEDVPGDFFVDTTCIDCDTCRQLAPAVFAEGDDHAYVHQQPRTPEDRRAALRALVSCPTGSIGSQGGDRPASVLGDFPLAIWLLVGVVSRDVPLICVCWSVAPTATLA